MSGSRRSSSRASASAARRTSVKLQRGSMGTFTCMPREPEVFGKPDQAVLLEHGAGLERHAPHGVEGDAGLGIEVDAQLVGMVGVAAAHRPRVQVEAPEVDRPQDVGHVDRAQLLGAAPARERHRHRLEPRRAARRHPLLVEERPLGAVGVALEHGRALAHPPQGAGADGEVVADQVELGLAPGREEDLVRVGDLHAVPVDLDRDGGHPGGHASMLTRIAPSAAAGGSALERTGDR